MQNIKPVASEYQKLQAAWKKAEREGELVVPCQTLSDARRLRFSLYNAVKPVREGKLHDPALLKAVNGVSLQIRENPIRLVMQNRAQSSAIMALDAVLGEEELLGEGHEPPVMTKEEAESLQRLQGLVSAPTGGETAPTRATPYYVREEG